MRPNWLTISIVPAICAALVGASVAEVLVWYSMPRPTLATNAGVPAPRGSGALIGQSTVTRPADAPKKPPEAGDAASQPSPKRDDADKDAGPWWSVLLGRLAWPFAFLFTLTFVAYNARLARIFGFGTRLIRKISAGGVEIEINSETVELAQRQLHGTFQDLITGAAQEYERIAEIQDIPTLVKNAIVSNVGSGIKGFRGTIHVNDVIFPDYLYQLVDYYPNGGGAHRRFSQRYGIIGRSWRSKISHGTGDAFAGAGSVGVLIENWGMTEEEAHGQQVNTRPSCLSVVVRHQSIPMGILFIDSTDKNAFGDDPAALAKAKAIEGSQSVLQLGEALSKTLAPLRTAAPSLKIKGPAG